MTVHDMQAGAEAGPSRADEHAQGAGHAPADAAVQTADEALRERLVDAMLTHVPFDGWSRAAIDAAAAELGVDPAQARRLFPRGGVDAALAFHRRGDRLMAERLAHAPLGSMRVRDRIAFAIRARIEAVAPHREAVRRAAALLALPIHAPDAARALWGTADAIWRAVGDDSQDVNWYTKRATLAAVYSAAVLYWLADESPGWVETWNFIDRRIEDVMRIERAKAAFRANPLGRAFLRGPGRLLEAVRAPGAGGPPHGAPDPSGPAPAGADAAGAAPAGPGPRRGSGG
ncbi:ubiquinone biosynthesis protein COQ9 [Oceanicella actignis]|nr:COQ9 family protein [Oceanicella actignis]TYO90761.1 ubiquinone biosynthesis protein COQ9 [Oceanicella actignis]